MIVLPDSGPIWRIVSPRPTPENQACRRCLGDLRRAGTQVLVAEIVDYEVRRETLRVGNPRALAELETLIGGLGYLALNTPAMRLAAQFWADARRRGLRTADDRALDVDVILAAQAATLAAEGEEVVVATTNVGHLGMFVPARHWSAVAS